MLLYSAMFISPVTSNEQRPYSRQGISGSGCPVKERVRRSTFLENDCHPSRRFLAKQDLDPWMLSPAKDVHFIRNVQRSMKNHTSLQIHGMASNSSGPVYEYVVQLKPDIPPPLRPFTISIGGLVLVILFLLLVGGLGFAREATLRRVDRKRRARAEGKTTAQRRLDRIRRWRRCLRHPQHDVDIEAGISTQGVGSADLSPAYDHTNTQTQATEADESGDTLTNLKAIPKTRRERKDGTPLSGSSRASMVSTRSSTRHSSSRASSLASSRDESHLPHNYDYRFMPC